MSIFFKWQKAFSIYTNRLKSEKFKNLINIFTCVFKVFIWNKLCKINIMVWFGGFSMWKENKFNIIDNFDLNNQRTSRCKTKIIRSNSMLRITSDLMICTRQLHVMRSLWSSSRCNNITNRYMHLRYLILFFNRKIVHSFMS